MEILIVRERRSSHLERSNRQLAQPVDVGPQDIVFSDFEGLLVWFRVQKIVYFFIIDLHVRHLDFVRELGTLLFRYHVKEVVAQSWYYPFVVTTAHHRVRLPGACKPWEFC